MNEERRLRREEAQDQWKKLEKDVEAAKGTTAVEKAQHISSAAKPAKLLMDEEKTVEELLMEDED